MDNKTLEMENAVTDILRKRQKKEEFWEKNEAEKENYKKVLADIAGSKNGVYFLKVLIQYIDLYGFRGSLNPQDMYVSRGKKAVYLEMIRPYLTKEQIQRVEND